MTKPNESDTIARLGVGPCHLFGDEVRAQGD